MPPNHTENLCARRSRPRFGSLMAGREARLSPHDLLTIIFMYLCPRTLCTSHDVHLRSQNWRSSGQCT